MGGKGIRRREKNFRASHGDSTRLPPPPKTHDIDAIPSKLRTIIKFKNTGTLQHGSFGNSMDSKYGQGKGGVFDGRKANQRDARSSVAGKLSGKESGDHASLRKCIDDKAESRNASSHDKKEKHIIEKMSRNVLYTGDMEKSGDRLKAGESLINGKYRLTMQLDANLVLYDLEKPIWASNTNGKGTNCYAVLQTDGNLVIYPSGSNKAIWASNTHGKGNGNYVLVLQNDRNLVIYTDPTWATKTNK